MSWNIILYLQLYEKLLSIDQPQKCAGTGNLHSYMGSVDIVTAFNHTPEFNLVFLLGSSSSDGFINCDKTLYFGCSKYTDEKRSLVCIKLLYRELLKLIELLLSPTLIGFCGVKLLGIFSYFKSLKSI